MILFPYDLEGSIYIVYTAYLIGLTLCIRIISPESLHYYNIIDIRLKSGIVCKRVKRGFCFVIIIEQKRHVFLGTIRTPSRGVAVLQPGIFVNHTPYCHTIDVNTIHGIYFLQHIIDLFITICLLRILTGPCGIRSIIFIARLKIQFCKLNLTHDFSIGDGRILNLVRRRSGHIIVCLHAHTGNSGRKIGILLMRFDLCKKLRDTIYLIA